MGVEAGTVLALSALLQTCISETWEKLRPLRGCGSEQGQQYETKDYEAECSRIVNCMSMTCISYIMLGSFLP